MELLVDLGFGICILLMFRLLDIDAPEKRGLTKEAGDATTAHLESLMPVDSEVLIMTKKDRKGKYGRYLARVHKDSVCVNDQMVEAGHAVYKEY